MNPQFTSYFINRYADLINTIWQQDKVQNIGNSMINEVAPWISRLHEMWGGSMTDFENKMINNLSSIIKIGFRPLRNNELRITLLKIYRDKSRKGFEVNRCLSVG